jgi:hypothetical protein
MGQKVKTATGKDNTIYLIHWIELNGICIRALPGPMHLGLKTGPLCPLQIPYKTRS